jgi:outer membrane protein TolC
MRWKEFQEEDCLEIFMRNRRSLAGTVPISFLALLWILTQTPPSMAQRTLTLPQAVRIALEQHPTLQASEAAEDGAAQRVAAARAEYFPSIDYAESMQWGNNPVYVFGSLLEQHRFRQSNFALQSLNRPDALTNFSSQLVAEQMLFDGNRTRGRLRGAQLGLEMTREQKRLAEMEILTGVAEAYFGALLARENREAAQRALDTVEADLERALSLRDAGMTTNADVLSLRVSRAESQERFIRSENDLELAMARLNYMMGEPLGLRFDLADSLRPAAPVGMDIQQADADALAHRPEVMQAQMALSQARLQNQIIRAGFLPQVSVMGTFEVNREAFASRGGTNWMTGATLRWNLFRGGADRAQLTESSLLQTQREAEQRQVSSSVQLEVHQAFLSLEAANRRIDVGEAGIAQAEESHRITADRYEVGLANATDLLRSQTALSEARTRYLAAVFDQRMATIQVERAAGVLNLSSEALQP